MTPDRSKEAAVKYAVIALEGIVAVAAFGGGAAMIADPTGAMGLPPELLDRLPVDSWLLPGVALIASNGLLPAAAAGAELRGRRWPRRFGHTVAGAVLLAWPVTETMLFGYPLRGEPVWLRPAVAAAGVALIGLGLLLRRSLWGTGPRPVSRRRGSGPLSTAADVGHEELVPAEPERRVCGTASANER